MATHLVTDFSELAAAHTAAAPAGDTIVMVAGTYTLSGNFSFTKSLHIVAVGSVVVARQAFQFSFIGQAGGSDITVDGDITVTEFGASDYMVVFLGTNGPLTIVVRGMKAPDGPSRGFHMDAAGNPVTATFISCAANGSTLEGWEAINGGNFSCFDCIADGAKLAADVDSGSTASWYRGSVVGCTTRGFVASEGANTLNIYGVTNADSGIGYVSGASGEMRHCVLTYDTDSAGANHVLDGTVAMYNCVWNSNDADPFSLGGDVTAFDCTFTFTGTKSRNFLGSGTGTSAAYYRCLFDASGASMTGNNNGFFEFSGDVALEACIFLQGVNTTSTNNTYSIVLGTESSGYVRNCIFPANTGTGRHRGIRFRNSVEISECIFEAFEQTEGQAINVTTDSYYTGNAETGRNVFATSSTVYIGGTGELYDAGNGDVIGTLDFVDAGSGDYRLGASSDALAIGENVAFLRPHFALDVIVNGSGSVAGAIPGSTTTRMTGGDAGAFAASDYACTLTVTPDAGSEFSGWAGDASGSTNPLSVTLDATKNVIAQLAVSAPTSREQVLCDFDHLPEDGSYAVSAVAVTPADRKRFFCEYTQNAYATDKGAVTFTAEVSDDGSTWYGLIAEQERAVTAGADTATPLQRQDWLYKQDDISDSVERWTFTLPCNSAWLRIRAKETGDAPRTGAFKMTAVRSRGQSAGLKRELAGLL